MSQQLTPEELKNLFLDYLDDKGLYHEFVSFIESKGYTVEELGIEEE